MITKELIEDMTTVGIHVQWGVDHSYVSHEQIAKLVELQRQRERQAVPSGEIVQFKKDAYEALGVSYPPSPELISPHPSMEGMHYEHVHVDPSDESDAGKVPVLVPDGFTIVATHWLSNIWYAAETLSKSDSVIDRNEAKALHALYAAMSR